MTAKTNEMNSTVTLCCETQAIGNEFKSKHVSHEIREDRILADIIKNTHSKLREKIQSINGDLLNNHDEIEDAIWNEHANARMKNEFALNSSEVDNTTRNLCYSEAMRKLADKFWSSNMKENTDIGENSRVEWLNNHINKYLLEDREKFCERLERRRNYNNSITSSCYMEKSPVGKWKLAETYQVLDVGSCHDPLLKECLNKNINVTPIDLCPSSKSVFKCDFIRVPITQMDKPYVISEYDESYSITSLKENGFDVVVFCLLLEYLPSPRLRYVACQRAKSLLKTNGVLLIVTPDSSKNQAKNEIQMKSWRLAMANMGLLRIYIEKQRHLRCLGFVKVDKLYENICKEESEKIKSALSSTTIAESQDRYMISEPKSEDETLLFIPQDSTTKEVLVKRNRTLVYTQNKVETQLEGNLYQDFFEKFQM